MLQCMQGLGYEERLRKLGLPTLEYRRARADVVQVYKLLKGLDVTTQDIITKRGDSVTRGHCLKLFKPRARTNLGKNVFSHRVVDPWNDLPPEIVNAPSLNSFKSRLNKVWRGPTKFQASCYIPYS